MASILRSLGRKLPVKVKIGIHRATSELGFRYNDGVVTAPDGQVFDVAQGMSRIDHSALKRGDYERTEIAVLRNYFKLERGTIIDIGANIGVVARYAIAEKLERGGTYVCVEPNPASFAALEANMQRARILYPGNDIQVVKAAVGDPAKAGTEMDFFARPNLGSGLASMLKRAGRETTIRVPITSLSNLVEMSPAGRTISLICDAEGGEIPMMYQDSAALSKIHQIEIELHGPNITGRRETIQDMVEQLRSLGFQRRGGQAQTHYFSRDLEGSFNS